VKTTKSDYTARDLAGLFTEGALLRNEEYQRGEAWDLRQKQVFLDSIFRSYPIPPLFFHDRRKTLSRGHQVTRWEIVDGQQRLLALTQYLKGDFRLLSVTDRRFPLPAGVRQMPAPWAGKAYNELAPELQAQLDETVFPVFTLAPETAEDEVRDLFIRLQAGTPLTRQQVRDAWPGPIGPFVTRLAGKLGSQARIGLFGVIDKRSERSTENDDAADAFVVHRQSCAQLLRLFLARRVDPEDVPSVGAKDLDALYHESTDFSEDSQLARDFVEILGVATDIFRSASRIRLSSGRGQKEKFRRLEVMAVVMFLQDVRRASDFRFDHAALHRLAERIASPSESVASGGARHFGARHLGLLLSLARSHNNGARRSARPEAAL
jgi:hypothetical protein